MPICDHCKTKKVGSVSFVCKCNYKTLCIKCRYPFVHNCSYDFKNEWKNNLEKNLPVVIADKLTKI